jgi:hypothetical protein
LPSLGSSALIGMRIRTGIQPLIRSQNRTCRRFIFLSYRKSYPHPICSKSYAIVKNRLHVSDSVYESRYDSAVRFLAQFALEGFRFLILHYIPITTVYERISGNIDPKFKSKPPSAGNRAQNRTVKRRIAPVDGP